MTRPDPLLLDHRAWGVVADPVLSLTANRLAAEIIDPALLRCARLAEPFQHAVPLLAAARLLAGLAALCADDPAFIALAAAIGQRIRRDGFAPTPGCSSIEADPDADDG